LFVAGENGALTWLGVDTRVLTKKIRENGTLLGKVRRPVVD